MRRKLDQFDFRIGPTTVALVKSTNGDRLWCAHTMQFSVFCCLCVQHKTKISLCVPGADTALAQLYVASWVLSCKVAQYPVRWTAHSASHFLPPPGRPVHSDTNSASSGSILSMQQLRATTKSLTFPPLEWSAVAQRWNAGLAIK